MSLRQAAASVGDTLVAFEAEMRDLDLRGSRARECTKAVCCVVAALGLSFACFEVEDAYWVAFTAFMITRASASETLWRGVLRCLGTLGGAIVGLLLAPFTANDTGLLMVSVAAVGFVAIFQFQVSRHSYAWMFFGMTALLVLSVTLAAPGTVIPFAALRVAEITLGVLTSTAVAWLFEVIWPQSGPASPPSANRLPLWRGLRDEAWVRTQWPHLLHAARGGVALVLLVVVWRWIELQDFVGTAVTSFMVMLVPAGPVKAGKEEAVRDRGVHRLVGCLLGGAYALLCLPWLGDDPLVWLLCLSSGVWLAAWIQNGSRGISYCGSQFALVFLATFVQGSGPPTSIIPGLERLEGVVIGLAVLGFVVALWQLPQALT